MLIAWWDIKYRARHRGRQLIRGWWTLVGRVPGGDRYTVLYERVVLGGIRELAHSRRWHVSGVCHGRRDCGPPIDGKVHGYLEHPRLPWYRWT